MSNYSVWEESKIEKLQFYAVYTSSVFITFALAVNEEKTLCVSYVAVL